MTKSSDPLPPHHEFRSSAREGPAKATRARLLSHLSLFLFALLVSLSFASCTRRAVPGTVKIALVAPFEGYYRATGYDAIYAARLAVREINSAGGLQGWRLELVAYDDRGEPELAQRSAQSVTLDPEILVVLGHYLMSTTTAACTVYADAHLPMVVLGAWAQNSPTTWYLMPSPNAMARAMLAATGALGEACFVEGEGPVAQVLRQRVLSRALVPSATACVYSTMPAIQAGEWITAARAAGWRGTLVGDLQLANPSFAKLATSAVLSSTFVTPYPLPKDLVDTQSWIEAYRGVGPHVPEPGIYAVPTYEAVYLVARAIDRMLRVHGDPSRTALNDALGLADHSGALGRLQLESDGHWTLMKLYRYHWTAEDTPPQLMRDAP